VLGDRHELVTLLMAIIAAGLVITVLSIVLA
jgi:hypothetical protein